jgi:ATP-dependent Lhr-like helicase
VNDLRPATRTWFEEQFGAPTEVQRRGWDALARGAHALLVAPTGSGKTLAAFLRAIDELAALPEDAPPGVRVVYVSPLKALVADIERNLRAPLAGIARTAARLGLPARVPRVDVRTGDTPQEERRRQARDPGEILVTTPESLYLVLGSKQRETLRAVETVIVDEVHAVCATKRGVHLALSLERLAALAHADPRRIGLSATVRPLEEVARYLGGDREVELVDALGEVRSVRRGLAHPMISSSSATPAARYRANANLRISPAWTPCRSSSSCDPNENHASPTFRR